jgi:hypothetical protein
MAALHLSVPHGLGQAEAQARLERFLEQIRTQHAAELNDVRGGWTDNVLEIELDIRGIGISSRMIVEETHVHVSGPLPLAALFFRGRIEQTIRGEIERALA